MSEEAKVVVLTVVIGLMICAVITGLGALIWHSTSSDRAKELRIVTECIEHGGSGSVHTTDGWICIGTKR